MRDMFSQKNRISGGRKEIRPNERVAASIWIYKGLMPFKVKLNERASNVTRNMKRLLQNIRTNPIHVDADLK